MPDEATNSKTTSRPKRRWFRYSLRTFLIAVTAICLFVGLKLVPILQQKQAVSALKGNGTYITYQYDYELPYYRGEQKGNPPPEPAWPAKLLGVDSCHDVVKVQLIEKGFEPEEFKRALSALRYLRRLRFLQIYAPHVRLEDPDLEPLADLKELKQLYLYGNQLGDGAVKHLRKLNQLKTLTLMWNRIGDQGLADLSGLKDLETLDLAENQVTDAGLNYLGQLTNLRELTLAKNQINGAGLRNLDKLTNLRMLILDDNLIEDEGLAEIVNLPALELVSVAGTNVTDASVQSLAKLPRACEICISGSRITVEGVERLHQLLPEASIVIKGRVYDNDPSAASAPVFYSPNSN